jgi:hypothetical protein
VKRRETVGAEKPYLRICRTYPFRGSCLTSVGERLAKAPSKVPTDLPGAYSACPCMCKAGGRLHTSATPVVDIEETQQPS